MGDFNSTKSCESRCHVKWDGEQWRCGRARKEELKRSYDQLVRLAEENLLYRRGELENPNSKESYDQRLREKVTLRPSHERHHYDDLIKTLLRDQGIYSEKDMSLLTKGKLEKILSKFRFGPSAFIDNHEESARRDHFSAKRIHQRLNHEWLKSFPFPDFDPQQYVEMEEYMKNVHEMAKFTRDAKIVQASDYPQNLRVDMSFETAVKKISYYLREMTMVGVTGKLVEPQGAIGSPEVSAQKEFPLLLPIGEGGRLVEVRYRVDLIINAWEGIVVAGCKPIEPSDEDQKEYEKACKEYSESYVDPQTGRKNPGKGREIYEKEYGAYNEDLYKKAPLLVMAPGTIKRPCLPGFFPSLVTLLNPYNPGDDIFPHKNAQSVREIEKWFNDECLGGERQLFVAGHSRGGSSCTGLVSCLEACNKEYNEKALKEGRPTRQYIDENGVYIFNAGFTKASSERFLGSSFSVWRYLDNLRKEGISNLFCFKTPDPKKDLRERYKVSVYQPRGDHICEVFREPSCADTSQVYAISSLNNIRLKRLKYEGALEAFKIIDSMSLTANRELECYEISGDVEAAFEKRFLEKAEKIGLLNEQLMGDVLESLDLKHEKSLKAYFEKYKQQLFNFHVQDFERVFRLEEGSPLSEEQIKLWDAFEGIQSFLGKLKGNRSQLEKAYTTLLNTEEPSYLGQEDRERFERLRSIARDSKEGDERRKAAAGQLLFLVKEKGQKHLKELPGELKVLLETTEFELKAFPYIKNELEASALISRLEKAGLSREAIFTQGEKLSPHQQQFKTLLLDCREFLIKAGLPQDLGDKNPIQMFRDSLSPFKKFNEESFKEIFELPSSPLGEREKKEYKRLREVSQQLNLCFDQTLYCRLKALYKARDAFLGLHEEVANLHQERKAFSTLLQQYKQNLKAEKKNLAALLKGQQPLPKGGMETADFEKIEAFVLTHGAKAIPDTSFETAVKQVLKAQGPHYHVLTAQLVEPYLFKEEDLVELLIKTQSKGESDQNRLIKKHFEQRLKSRIEKWQGIEDFQATCNSPQVGEGVMSTLFNIGRRWNTMLELHSGTGLNKERVVIFSSKKGQRIEPAYPWVEKVYALFRKAFVFYLAGVAILTISSAVSEVFYQISRVFDSLWNYKNAVRKTPPMKRDPSSKVLFRADSAWGLNTLDGRRSRRGSPIPEDEAITFNSPEGSLGVSAIASESSSDTIGSPDTSSSGSSGPPEMNTWISRLRAIDEGTQAQGESLGSPRNAKGRSRSYSEPESREIRGLAQVIPESTKPQRTQSESTDGSDTGSFHWSSTSLDTIASRVSSAGDKLLPIT